MVDVDVVVLGGGVCGVLAAQKLKEAGFTVKLVEKRENYGGVWSYRANPYSHLQAYAALYQWHEDYPLDKQPFAKVPGTKVLETLRRFAQDFHLEQCTLFEHEVLSVSRVAGRYMVTAKDLKANKEKNIIASAVFVCTGLLGRQYTPQLRDFPHLQSFAGQVMYAGREGNAKNALEGSNAQGKDVVILGSGAFGLEAMEAAHRGGARSITLVTRPRDRWIVPFSQQFKLIVLLNLPLVPRWLKCYLLNTWLRSVYIKCGISSMAPSRHTSMNFTGQCNDAFFTYPKQGFASYIDDSVAGFGANSVKLKGGKELAADILVLALGHEVLTEPAFLKNLGVGFTTDLHNFAFLGKDPYVGAASDWVWFNVPHGPQKQINSFISVLQACRKGKEKEAVAALLPTAFVGCKGEPLNPALPSGLVVRNRAYFRSRSAGLPWYGKALTWVRLEYEALSIWLKCCGVCVWESIVLRNWMSPKAP